MKTNNWHYYIYLYKILVWPDLPTFIVILSLRNSNPPNSVKVYRKSDFEFHFEWGTLCYIHMYSNLAWAWHSAKRRCCTQIYIDRIKYLTHFVANIQWFWYTSDLFLWRGKQVGLIYLCSCVCDYKLEWGNRHNCFSYHGLLEML